MSAPGKCKRKTRVLDTNASGSSVLVDRGNNDVEWISVNSYEAWRLVAESRIPLTIAEEDEASHRNAPCQQAIMEDPIEDEALRQQPIVENLIEDEALHPNKDEALRRDAQPMEPILEDPNEDEAPHREAPRQQRVVVYLPRQRRCLSGVLRTINEDVEPQASH